jgi:hypothetical protein
VAQVVEQWPSKHKALSSNPSTTKNKILNISTALCFDISCMIILAVTVLPIGPKDFKGEQSMGPARWSLQDRCPPLQKVIYFLNIFCAQGVIFPE